MTIGQVKGRVKSFGLLLGTSMVLFTLGVQNTFAKPFDQVLKNVKNTAKNGGYSTKNVDETTFAGAIGYFIQVLLGFMGIIFAVLIIYGGIQWMVAGGDSGKVEKAKTTIINSVIGLAIVMGAMWIVTFISDIFYSAF